MTSAEDHPHPWEEAGSIGVDSGRVWLGDPGYVILDPGTRRPIDLGRGWHDMVPKMVSGTTEQWHFDDGRPGLGVSVATGFGDGTYSVWVRKTPSGRVAAVMIEFIEEGDDDDPQAPSGAAKPGQVT